MKFFRRLPAKAPVAALLTGLALSTHGLLAQPAPLTPVPSVDLNRYLGTWYQVALYPNRFQAQCASDTAATYTPLPDNRLQVLNRCRQASGEVDQALGVARVTGPATLQVRFAPAWLSWLPFVWGDYWVIQLADDYRYAVVSEPRREYLWVLSRSPQLSAEDDQRIRAQLQAQGFDLERLKSHPQTQPLTP
ncbi:lipocalin family protein [Caldimonas caldifontis]|uniref:Outer membrane lipoprotein Blc n=1 Tax=Caldimonas caldifontis TaxID=1452508 RepID=A0A2S5SXI1_9BURK|nr:lipocalin family protein [Caldimonas caldifontis]PPE67436.1 lipocalin [Caldimonas caldifontis]